MGIERDMKWEPVKGKKRYINSNFNIFNKGN